MTENQLITGVPSVAVSLVSLMSLVSLVYTLSLVFEVSLMSFVFVVLLWQQYLCIYTMKASRNVVSVISLYALLSGYLVVHK